MNNPGDFADAADMSPSNAAVLRLQAAVFAALEANVPADRIKREVASALDEEQRS